MNTYSYAWGLMELILLWAKLKEYYLKLKARISYIMNLELSRDKEWENEALSQEI